APSDAKKKKKKASKVKKAKSKTPNAAEKNGRAKRPYPASSFEDALPIAQAIQTFASGEKVRRLTLLGQLNKSPSSSGTRQLITNSNRYGLTSGSYAAEWLELTQSGKIVTNPDTDSKERLSTQFKLAIEGIEAFNHLYTQYKGKKLPSHEVMKDALRESKLP